MEVKLIKVAFFGVSLNFPHPALGIGKSMNVINEVDTVANRLKMKSKALDREVSTWRKDEEDEKMIPSRNS